MWPKGSEGEPKVTLASLSYMEGQLADGLPLVVLMTVGGLCDNTKTGRQRQGMQKILRTPQSLD